MSNTRSTTPPKGRVTPPRPRQVKPEPPQITFKGKKYRVADKIGVWPLMQFSRAAEAGVTMADYRGLAAAHAMLQDAIHPEDWGRFQEDMIVSKEDDLNALLDAASQATELIMNRMNRSNGRAPVKRAIEDTSGV